MREPKEHRSSRSCLLKLLFGQIPELRFDIVCFAFAIFFGAPHLYIGHIVFGAQSRISRKPTLAVIVESLVRESHRVLHDVLLEVAHLTRLIDRVTLSLPVDASKVDLEKKVIHVILGIIQLLDILAGLVVELSELARDHIPDVNADFKSLELN